jgi:hypothetical protein
MATYNEDGTNTYEPGESNDRAVPPVDGDPAAPDGGGDVSGSRVDHPRHPIAGRPGRPDDDKPARPTHPIAPTPEPKHRS